MEKKDKEVILLVCPSLAIGGRERIAVNTASCLMDDFAVKMVVFHDAEVKYDCPCEVINLNLLAKSSGKLTKALFQMRRAFHLSSLRKRYKPKAVISFSTTANLTNALSSSAPGKTIAAIHGFSSLAEDVENKFILPRADCTICISKEMRSAYEKKYPGLGNLVTIENGYDIESTIKRSFENAEYRKGRPTYIAMGRLDKVKGYNRLIKAYKLTKKTQPDSKLVFLGKGELMGELKELAKELEIDDSVEFLGNKTNPYAYLRQSDVFLLSSHNEGFPNSIIEALACSLPVVAVDCQSGPREILSSQYSDDRIRGVEYAEYGVLVEDDSDDDVFAEKFAVAMTELTTNKELLKKYKATAKTRAACYSIERYKERIMEIL